MNLPPLSVVTACCYIHMHIYGNNCFRADCYADSYSRRLEASRRMRMISGIKNYRKCQTKNKLKQKNTNQSWKENSKECVGSRYVFKTKTRVIMIRTSRPSCSTSCKLCNIAARPLFCGSIHTECNSSNITARHLFCVSMHKTCSNSNFTAKHLSSANIHRACWEAQTLTVQ
jgi:hypothetical protein